MKNALLSVTDKSGLLEFAEHLTSLGWTIYATSGTRRYLQEGGLGVQSVESLTQTPEWMDGRVKTLNPKIFAGILARRDHESDIAEVKKWGIVLFDLVVVNLYAFEQYLGKFWKEQAAHIDIGGPSLLRAAAKNFESVCVVSDPVDYPLVLTELAKQENTTLELRRRLAVKAFELTSRYDSMIHREWNPRAQALRYGENPHQKAWFAPESDTDWRVLQGKELSYNNLLDADSAARLVNEFAETAVAIVKHTNPCGVASGLEPVGLIFKKALDGDPVSAFGGIIAANREIDESAAIAMTFLFLEVIVAPAFSEGARKVFQTKQNLRLVEWPHPRFGKWDFRNVMGGQLAQTTDEDLGWERLRTVTTTAASSMVDLKFAWVVAKHAKSNAIVIARNQQVLGVGSGQVSRVDAVELALKKATGKDLKGAVLASDAFFPFRDNIDRLKGLGIVCIVQPGGSQRDAEVIAACDEHAIAMVFTGFRHFRH